MRDEWSRSTSVIIYKSITLSQFTYEQFSCEIRAPVALLQLQRSAGAMDFRIEWMKYYTKKRKKYAPTIPYKCVRSRRAYRLCNARQQLNRFRFLILLGWTCTPLFIAYVIENQSLAHTPHTLFFFSFLPSLLVPVINARSNASLANVWHETGQCALIYGQKCCYLHIARFCFLSHF